MRRHFSRSRSVRRHIVGTEKKTHNIFFRFPFSSFSSNVPSQQHQQQHTDEEMNKNKGRETRHKVSEEKKSARAVRAPLGNWTCFCCWAEIFDQQKTRIVIYIYIWLCVLRVVVVVVEITCSYWSSSSSRRADEEERKQNESSSSSSHVVTRVWGAAIGRSLFQHHLLYIEGPTTDQIDSL